MAAAYRVLEKCFIGDAIRLPGEIVAVSDDFIPGPHLAPAVDAQGREDPEARAAMDRAQPAALPVPGDPAYIGSLIKHTLEDGTTNGAVNVLSGNASVPGAPSGPGVRVDPVTGQVVGVVNTVAGVAPGVVPTLTGGPVQAPTAFPDAPIMVPAAVLAATKDELEALTSDHADLDAAHQALLKDRDAAKAQVADLQAMRDDAVKKETYLLQQLDAATARAEAAEKAHAQVQADLDAATAPPADPAPKKGKKGSGDDAPDA